MAGAGQTLQFVVCCAQIAAFEADNGVRVAAITQLLPYTARSPCTHAAPNATREIAAAASNSAVKEQDGFEPVHSANTDAARVQTLCLMAFTGRRFLTPLSPAVVQSSRRTEAGTSSRVATPSGSPRRAHGTSGDQQGAELLARVLESCAPNKLSLGQVVALAEAARYHDAEGLLHCLPRYLAPMFAQHPRGALSGREVRDQERRELSGACTC